MLPCFTKKLLKRLIFYRAKADEYSPSKFYYPEDLETCNVETEQASAKVRRSWMIL